MNTEALLVLQKLDDEIQTLAAKTEGLHDKINKASIYFQQGLE